MHPCVSTLSQYQMRPWEETIIATQASYPLATPATLLFHRVVMISFIALCDPLQQCDGGGKGGVSCVYSFRPRLRSYTTGACVCCHVFDFCVCVCVAMLSTPAGSRKLRSKRFP